MEMKNRFLIFLSCLFMLICLTFVGCKPNEENTAYISASNTTLVLNQTYMVGDKLQLNGQKIDYFENIKNTVPTEKDIVVTNDMISGFNTENEGQFTLKINYKNALALSVNYTVYAVPSLKVYNGTYISPSIGKNTTIEISDNKATINYYEKGYVEYHYNSPTKTTEVDLTLGVLSNGNAKLSFVYENNKYFFSNFNENGKPSLLSKIDNDEHETALISASCTLLENIIAPKIGGTYISEIKSSDSEFNGRTLTIMIHSDTIDISTRTDGIENLWQVNNYTVNISPKFVISCKTTFYDSLTITAVSENEIVVTLKDNAGNIIFDKIHCNLEKQVF